MEELTVEIAKAFLKSKGYYAETLWTIHDIKKKISDEKKFEIIGRALNKEATVEEIRFAINFELENL